MKTIPLFLILAGCCLVLGSDYYGSDFLDCVMPSDDDTLFRLYKLFREDQQNVRTYMKAYHPELFIRETMAYSKFIDTFSFPKLTSSDVFSFYYHSIWYDAEQHGPIAETTFVSIAIRCDIDDVRNALVAEGTRFADSTDFFVRRDAKDEDIAMIQCYASDVNKVVGRRTDLWNLFHLKD